MRSILCRDTGRCEHELDVYYDIDRYGGIGFTVLLHGREVTHLLTEKEKASIQVECEDHAWENRE